VRVEEAASERCGHAAGKHRGLGAEGGERRGMRWKACNGCAENGE